MKKELNFDVIVVGSGVGGATFTDYLLRKHPTIKVAVLESGPYRTKENFNQREIDMTALYYNRGAVVSKNLQVGVSAANTLGGSSAVYTGVSFRPPEKVIQNWRTEFGMHFLTSTYVNESLDEIEKELSVHELPVSRDNDNNKLFRQGAEALDYPIKRLKINTKNCKQQGFCNLGCTTGAKQGALEVQIPRILKAGVEIFCNTKVISIEENKLMTIVSDAPTGTKPNSLSSGKYIFKAKKIILAAGVLNTPAILLRSADALRIKNKNTGRFLTLHPAFNINGIQPKTIKNFRGFPKTVYSDHFSDTDDFYLETSFYFPGVTAKNNPGYGISHQEIMRDYDKMMSILILAHDKAEFRNRIKIDKKGKSVIDYTVSLNTKNTLIKALREAAKIFFKAGCTKVMLPASQKLPLIPRDLENIDNLIQLTNLNLYKTPLSSAHPQGGARMGKDTNNAVCDINGKVFGCKSIYVADASLFPTSVKVNPYETVMLLAKYIAENIPV